MLNMNKRGEETKFSGNNADMVVVVLLLYVQSQQLWSLRDGQFT